MTQQFGFRASRSLAEVENRDACWDNLGIDRRDLALLVGTSAAGVTEGDYFNCKNLTTFLEPQISGLTVSAGSGLVAMLGKISKNGDTGIGTLSGSTVNNDRAYYNAAFDIISASTNSFFSPTTTSGYSAGAQYLLGPVSLPNLTISGFNFTGNTKQWSEYFVKYRNHLRLTDSGGTQRFSPLYLAPPTVLDSNVLWLDAEFSEITLDGVGVRRWEDVLRRANASQAEANYRPTFVTNDLDNRPAVQFDGTNDFLNIGTLGATLPTAATLIVVFSLSSALTTGDSVYSIVSSLANISSAWRNGSGNGAWGLFTNSIISSFPVNMPVNGTVIASVRASSAYGLEFRLGGIRQSFIAPPSYSYSSAGNFVIGVSDSVSRSNAFQGRINALALFNEVLSDAELFSQEEYFRWRNGFVYNPDAADLSFTKVIHDERQNQFLLEDNSVLEAG
jgi:hypothetical protein